MKKFLALILVLLMVSSVLTGCSGDSSSKKNDDGEEKLKIALLCDMAGTQTFVLNMIEGLKESAERHGFEAIV